MNKDRVKVKRVSRSSEADEPKIKWTGQVQLLLIVDFLFRPKSIYLHHYCQCATDMLLARITCSLVTHYNQLMSDRYSLG